MTAHPHGEEISAYLDGMLDVWKMRQVARHLDSCVECRALHQSLRQTKLMLHEMASPGTPAPEFWLNTYRRLRVEDAKRPSWADALQASLSAGRQNPPRRLAAGIAAAALIGGAILTPILTHSTGTGMIGAGQPAVADCVDLSSLVRAHTQSAARQPLSDPDRQTMISADTDDTGLSDVTAETVGDGGSFAADAAH